MLRIGQVRWLALAGVLTTVLVAAATAAPALSTPHGSRSAHKTSSSLYRLLLLLPKPPQNEQTSSSAHYQAFMRPFGATLLPGGEFVRERSLGGVSLSIDSDAENVSTKNISDGHPLVAPQRLGSGGGSKESNNVLGVDNGERLDHHPSVLPEMRQVTFNDISTPVGGNGGTRATVAMVESFVDDMVRRPSGERPGYVMINSRNPAIIGHLVEGLTRRYGSTSVIHDQNVIQSIISNHQQTPQVIRTTPRPPPSVAEYMPVFPHRPHWQGTEAGETREMGDIIRKLSSLGHVTLSTGPLINNTLAEDSHDEISANTTFPEKPAYSEVGEEASVGDLSRTGNSSYVNESNIIDTMINPQSLTKFNYSLNDGESSNLNLSETSSPPTDLPALLVTSADAHDGTPPQTPDHRPAIQLSQGTQYLEQDVSRTRESGSDDKNKLEFDLRETINPTWKNTPEDTNKYEHVLDTSPPSTGDPSGVYIDNVFRRKGSLSNYLYNTNKSESQVPEVETNQSYEANGGSTDTDPEYTSSSLLLNSITNWSTPSSVYQTKHSVTMAPLENISSHRHEMKSEAVNTVHDESGNSPVSRTSSISTPSNHVSVASAGGSTYSYTETGLNASAGVSVAPESGAGGSVAGTEKAEVTAEEAKMSGTYNEDYYEEIDGKVVLSPTKFMRRTGPAGDFEDDYYYYYYYQEKGESGSADAHVVRKEPEESSFAEVENHLTKHYGIKPPGQGTDYGAMGEEHLRKQGSIREHVTEERPTIIHGNNGTQERQSAGTSKKKANEVDGEERTDGQVKDDEGGREEDEGVGGSEGGGGGGTRHTGENDEKTEKGNHPQRQPHHDPDYSRQGSPSFHSQLQNVLPTRLPAPQTTAPPQPRPQLTPEQQVIITRLPVRSQQMVSTLVQAKQATPIPPATPTIVPPAAPSVPLPYPYYPSFPHYPFYPPSTYYYPPPLQHHTEDHQSPYPHTAYSQGAHNHGVHNNGSHSLGTHSHGIDTHDGISIGAPNHGEHNHNTHGNAGHDRSTYYYIFSNHGLLNHSTQSTSAVTGNNTKQVASTVQPQAEVAILNPGVGPSRLGEAARLGDVEQVGVNRQGTPAQGGVRPNRNPGTLGFRQVPHQMSPGRPAPPRVTQYRPPQQAAMHAGAPAGNVPVVVPQVAPAPVLQQQEEGSLIDKLDTVEEEKEEREEVPPANDSPASMDREQANSLLQSLFSSPTLLLLGIVFATSAAYMAITMEEQAAQQRFQQAQLAAAFGGLPFPQPGRRRRRGASRLSHSSVSPPQEFLLQRIQ